MLQLELIKKESVQKSEVQKYNVLVQTEIDDQFDQVISMRKLTKQYYVTNNY